MKRTAALILALFFAGSAYAAAWTNGAQVVENIIWKPGFHGFYVTASAYHDPEGCGSGNRLYLVDPTLDEKTVDRLYAMLLTALTTGRALHVWVDGCQQGTLAPNFTGLQLNN